MEPVEKDEEESQDTEGGVGHVWGSGGDGGGEVKATGCLWSFSPGMQQCGPRLQGVSGHSAI